MNTKMKELLKEQEGLSLTPYKCTAGKLTIGYGYNLEEGISENVANILFDELKDNDYNVCNIFRIELKSIAQLKKLRKDELIIKNMFRIVQIGIS